MHIKKMYSQSPVSVDMYRVIQYKALEYFQLNKANIRYLIF